MAGTGRKGLLAGVAALILLVGGWMFLRQKSPAVSVRERGVLLLAEYLRTDVKPRAVLVIGNPFSQLPHRPAQVYEFERAGESGIQSGFGPGFPVKIAYPKLKPEVLENPGSVQVDPRSPTPLSFIVETDAFDEVIRANAESDLVISLIGLPVTLHSLNAWTKSGPPRFALLLPDWRIIGDLQAIQNAFASGKLVAALVAKPAGGAQQPYLVVHSNNFAECLRLYPQIFSQ